MSIVLSVKKNAWILYQCRSATFHQLENWNALHEIDRLIDGEGGVYQVVERFAELADFFGQRTLIAPDVDLFLRDLHTNQWPENDAWRQFGQPHAKLFPFIGRKVPTPDKKGAFMKNEAEMQLNAQPYGEEYQSETAEQIQHEIESMEAEGLICKTGEFRRFQPVYVLTPLGRRTAERLLREEEKLKT